MGLLDGGGNDYNIDQSMYDDQLLGMSQLIIGREDGTGDITLGVR